MEGRSKQIPLLLAIVLFTALSFWVNRPAEKNGLRQHTHEAGRESPECRECLEKEREKRIALLRSTDYLEHYIQNVIIHGSSQNFGFAYGPMQAGFADRDAAPKIAAYVVTLSGRKPTHTEWIKEGRTFYVSNCGGCHGEDGRGVHGTFPDLTRDPLLGIEKRIKEALELKR